MGTQAAASAVSPTEPARYLRPFPNWDSRCAVTRDFPARFKSGCWSKPNLVMYSLVYFSFLLMLVCWKQVRQFSNKYLCYLFVYNKWLILLTNPWNLKWKVKTWQSTRSSQRARRGSLCYTAAPHWLAMLHVVVYVCQWYFLFVPPSPSPTVYTRPFSASTSLSLPCK